MKHLFLKIAYLLLAYSLTAFLQVDFWRAKELFKQSTSIFAEQIFLESDV